jgi:CheY-like chemotaxis protein
MPRTSEPRPPAILVVEDDPAVREAVQDALELRGFRVFGASNGYEALAFLRGGERPSLVVLDLVMPVMSGKEFLEAKAGDPSIADLPVVVLSAIADPAALATDRRLAGALKKPVTLDQLLDVIDTVVWARAARSR